MLLFLAQILNSKTVYLTGSVGTESTTMDVLSFSSCQDPVGDDSYRIPEVAIPEDTKDSDTQEKDLVEGKATPDVEESFL